LTTSTTRNGLTPRELIGGFAAGWIAAELIEDMFEDAVDDGFDPDESSDGGIFRLVWRRRRRLTDANESLVISGCKGSVPWLHPSTTGNILLATSPH
jgi:hypothetical protein